MLSPEGMARKVRFPLTPEKTMAALQRVLPRKYSVEINKLLVPSAKHICTGKAPKCSQCPVLKYCRQSGVSEHR
jgi:endonuclease-3